MPLQGEHCCFSRLAGLKQGESPSTLEPYPSPVTVPDPASRTPKNHQSLQQAGLPAAPAHSSHDGSVGLRTPPLLRPVTTAATWEGKLLPPPCLRRPGKPPSRYRCPPTAAPPGSPHLMKISAIRKPMPEPPPVMNATWPLGEQRDGQSPAPCTAPGRGGPDHRVGRGRPYPRQAAAPSLSAPALTPGGRG